MNETDDKSPDEEVESLPETGDTESLSPGIKEQLDELQKEQGRLESELEVESLPETGDAEDPSPGIKEQLDELQKKQSRLESELEKVKGSLKVLTPTGAKVEEIHKSYQDPDDALSRKQLWERYQKWHKCFQDQRKMIEEVLKEGEADDLAKRVSEYDKRIDDLQEDIRKRDSRLNKSGYREKEIESQNASDAFTKAKEFQKRVDDWLKEVEAYYRAIADGDCLQLSKKYLYVLLAEDLLQKAESAIVSEADVESRIMQVFHAHNKAAEALDQAKKDRVNAEEELTASEKKLEELQKNRVKSLVDQVTS